MRVRAVVGLAFVSAALAAFAACSTSSNDGTGSGGDDAATSDTGAGAPADDGGAGGDGLAPSDGAVVGSSHPLAQTQACEAQLASEWATTPPSAGLGAASARAAYEAVLRKIMSDGQVPGAAVAVAKDGKLVLALGIGIADREAAIPARFDDRYRIASLSKQITATAILRLVEEGKLGLDDSVFSILSSYAPLPGKTLNAALGAITVRHLLQHRGGWNRDSEAVGDPMFQSQAIAAAFGIASPPDVEHVIRYMLDKPLTYAPGSTYCYSNFGYALLGRIIEQKSGTTYEDYVRTKVLAPAGATHTRLGKTLFTARADDEVRYYDYPDAALAPSVYPDAGAVPWPYGGFSLEVMDAHGGWLGTTVDTLRFALAVDGHASPPDVLTPQSLAAMAANPSVPWCLPNGTTTPASSSFWYGFGWVINSIGNAWHTGSLPGTATEDVIANSANGYAWAVFFNTRPAAQEQFAGRVDADMWTALANATSGGNAFGTDDLFDQAGNVSGWMSDAAYASEAASQAAGGKYPSRVEGRQNGSAREYRASFVPRHAGAQPTSYAGLDCVDYVAESAVATAAGQRLVTLHTFVDDAGVRRFQATWSN